VQSVLLALIELQKLEGSLREMEAERMRGPDRLSTLEEAFRAAEAEVGAAKHRYEQLKLERAHGELDLKTLEAKLTKFQGQLMGVRSSKEYSAALKEIDSVKSEISRLEDEVLAKMEEMTALEKDVPEAEARIAEERARYEATRASLEQELASLDSRLADLDARRRQIAKAIPEEVLEAFNRVTRARGGIAVVRTTEAVCPACNVRIRMQVFAQIRRGESLVVCDSCRRFLYYEENAEETAGISPGLPSDVPGAASHHHSGT